MNRERRFGKKRNPQGHGKKMRLKYIAILPSFITLMNAMCGFLAIVYASRGTSSQGLETLIFQRPGFTLFALSGYMIFIAMVADVLDGRVARLSKTTSSFGGQLDSLSDAISFGVAPAFLMLKLVNAHLQNLKYASPGLAVVIGRSVFLIAILYVLCAVIRLARFNVENEEDESAHMSFSGLPSPAAAGAVAARCGKKSGASPGCINGLPTSGQQQCRTAYAVRGQGGGRHQASSG